MPLLCTLDGVKVQMFMNDHPPPHFHVVFAEYKAQIEIATMKVMNGSLPKRKLKIVARWGRENERALSELFNRLNPPLIR
ncbi:DUF4160 domain-containing protein [Neolewinella aquimaris]|uniref:DUF4160 domain-containing protein n=1 Tax=Neolewinella aquimaris TaxID=1835722 RepID=UPI0038730561